MIPASSVHDYSCIPRCMIIHALISMAYRSWMVKCLWRCPLEKASSAQLTLGSASSINPGATTKVRYVSPEMCWPRGRAVVCRRPSRDRRAARPPPGWFPQGQSCTGRRSTSAVRDRCRPGRLRWTRPAVARQARHGPSIGRQVQCRHASRCRCRAHRPCTRARPGPCASGPIQ